MKFDEHLESAKIGLTIKGNERESSHFFQAQIAPKVPKLAALLISPYFSSRKPKLRRCIAKLQRSKLSLIIGARAVPQFVVVDLKKGEFKPEYAGKMNLGEVWSVVDTKWRQVLDTKWRLVVATKWRQVVATGASPWFVPQPRFSVPKGRHESVLEQGSCRPFGTHRRGVFWSTGLRPWLHHAVPLGLNRIHSKPKACSTVPCTETRP